MSKEITKYWEETCIEFGKYVQQHWSRYEKPSILWNEFQKQMAQDVDEVLDVDDRCEKDNTLTINKQEGDVKDSFTTDYVKSRIEEGERSGFVDSLENKLK